MKGKSHQQKHIQDDDLKAKIIIENRIPKTTKQNKKEMFPKTRNLNEMLKDETQNERGPGRPSGLSLIGRWSVYLSSQNRLWCGGMCSSSWPHPLQRFCGRSTNQSSGQTSSSSSSQWCHIIASFTVSMVTMFILMTGEDFCFLKWFCFSRFLLFFFSLVVIFKFFYLEVICTSGPPYKRLIIFYK